MTDLTPLETAALTPGIRSRFVSDINGLRVHMLEAGFEAKGRPLVLLLHGFPELAYSWRKIMLPLAAVEFHVVAPDLRGYGRTTGWDADYDGDLASFRILNAVRDAMGLVAALGYRDVPLVAGHDFGASVAAWCARSPADRVRRRGTPPRRAAASPFSRNRRARGNRAEAGPEAGPALQSPPPARACQGH